LFNFQGAVQPRRLGCSNNIAQQNRFVNTFFKIFSTFLFFFFDIFIAKNIFRFLKPTFDSIYNVYQNQLLTVSYASTILNRISYFGLLLISFAPSEPRTASISAEEDAAGRHNGGNITHHQF
jgi:hypothetical protein